ncbi:MAG: hypothetical protein JXR37_30475 [Kiritimatiellae bacterium]|nr:hypothetical protein [Kiritimatiellia bacterium]
MRFLHALFGVVLFGVLLMTAVIVMYEAILGTHDLSQQVLGALGASTLWGFLAGLGLFLLVFFYLLTGVRRRRGDPYVAFKNENGTISVRVQAIHTVILELKEEFPDILNLRPAVVQGNGFIDVSITLRIRGGEHVTETCKLLKQRVRESLMDNLGIAEVRHVDVDIRDLVPGRQRAVSAPTAQPRVEETGDAGEDYRGVG